MTSKVLDIIKDRSSVREYLDRPIEKEKLDLILESARLAPSATNSQPWHFYLVTNKEKIKQIPGKISVFSNNFINGFIADAPVVVVVTAGPIDMLHKAMSALINKKWYYLDIGVAVEHMVLTAWDLGVGSCWIGWFDEKRVKNIFDIPKEQEVVALLTLGYAKPTLRPEKHRKRIEEIVKIVS